MIILKKGDLLSHVGTIVHSTNIEGVMGAGVAAYIKEKVPGAYKEYQKKIRSDAARGESGLGEYSVFHDTAHKRTIVNLNGQSVRTAPFWNYPPAMRSVMTNYHALDAGFARLVHDLDWVDFPMSSIGFPLIGCGLGGASWRIVSALIEERFPDYMFRKTVYVVDDESYEIVLNESACIVEEVA